MPSTRLRHCARQLRGSNLTSGVRRTHRSGLPLTCLVLSAKDGVLSVLCLFRVSQGRRLDRTKIQHAFRAGHHTGPRGGQNTDDDADGDSGREGSHTRYASAVLHAIECPPCSALFNSAAGGSHPWPRRTAESVGILYPLHDSVSTCKCMHTRCCYAF